MAEAEQHTYEEIDCVLCGNQWELQLLPCKHTICLPCIDTLSTEAKQKEEIPNCRICGLDILFPEYSSIDHRQSAALQGDFARVDVVRSAEQLNDEGRGEKKTRHPYNTVMSRCCYSVSETPAGQLLVGRRDGFDIVNGDSSLARSVSVSAGSVLCIQYHDEFVYTLCYKPNPSGRRCVIVFDRNTYTEVRRWSVPDHRNVSGLAVVNDKVFVSDPRQKQLCVYTVLGDHITNVEHLTFVKPTHLAISTHDYLIISDVGANKVHKLSCRIHKVKWTCSGVGKPLGVCCDTNGDAWVWSDTDKSIVQLHSQTGEIIREAKHDIFTDMVDASKFIAAMCITSDGRTLYAAALRKGLLQFHANAFTTATADSQIQDSFQSEPDYLFTWEVKEPQRETSETEPDYLVNMKVKEQRRETSQSEPDYLVNSKLKEQQREKSQTEPDYLVNRKVKNQQRETSQTEPDYLVTRKVKEQQRETCQREPDYLVTRKVKEQQREKSQTEPDYLVNRKVKEQQREASQSEPDYLVTRKVKEQQRETSETEPDYLVNMKVKEQRRETSPSEPDYLVNRKVKEQQRETSQLEPDYLLNRNVKEQQRETCQREPDYFVTRKVKEQHRENSQTEPDYLVNRKVKDQQRETSQTEPDYLVTRKVKEQQRETSQTEPDYLVSRKVKEQQRETS